MKSTCWDTRATDTISKSGQKDTEASIPSVFYFSDNSLVSMLFFMFLYCISIMVTVFQMKSLMDTRLLNLWAS